jgi:hypothetical protein
MFLPSIPEGMAQGHRRLRFSFSSSLVKEHCLVRQVALRQVALKRQTRTSDAQNPVLIKPSRPQGSRRSAPPQWPAVDEAFLHNHPNPVNNKIKSFSIFLLPFFAQTKSRQRNSVHRNDDVPVA